MTLRALFFLCIFGFIANTSTAQEPWAIMTGQSVLEIRSGIRHIYERLGRQDLVTELDKSGLNNLLSGNLNGLDLKRPLGCVILPNESGTGVVLAFIPITGEQAFLEFLKRHSVQVDIAKTGKPVVSIPQAGAMHLRFDQNCAWLAYSSSDLDVTLPDLSRIIPDRHREAHLASTVYLDRLPRDRRSQFLLHAQQGLSRLFKGEGLSMSKATEILILPLAGLMLNRLSSEATTLTILANTDIKTDKLWAKLLITPKQNSRLMTQTQERAVQPIRYDIPASLWARLRGKSPATAESAAKEAFSNGQSDQITTQITGADQLVVSIDFSGAFLAYHAALDRLEEPKEKRLPRRERRRDPTSDRH